METKSTNNKLLILIQNISIILTMILILATLAQAQPSPPIGVAGHIQKNGEPLTNHQITLKNLDTGQQKNFSTGTKGRYAKAIQGHQGDTIKISLSYNQQTYSNSISLNPDLQTNWLNLSFTTNNNHNNNTDNGDGNNSGGGIPSLPPQPPSNTPPTAQYTFHPTNPMVNQTLYLNSTSTDPNKDICNHTWTLQNQHKYTKNTTYIFNKMGNYQIILTVTDTNKTSTSITKTIPVSPQPVKNLSPSNQTQTNHTITINTTTSDQQIQIFQNQTLIKTIHTDKNHTASTTLPEGDYTLQTNNTSENLTLDSNTTIHLQSTSNTPSPEPQTPWLPITIIIICIIAIISIIILIKKRGIL